MLQPCYGRNFRLEPTLLLVIPWSRKIFANMLLFINQVQVSSSNNIGVQRIVCRLACERLSRPFVEQLVACAARRRTATKFSCPFSVQKHNGVAELTVKMWWRLQSLLVLCCPLFWPLASGVGRYYGDYVQPVQPWLMWQLMGVHPLPAFKPKVPEIQGQLLFSREKLDFR